MIMIITTVFIENFTSTFSCQMDPYYPQPPPNCGQAKWLFLKLTLRPGSLLSFVTEDSFQQVMC